MFISSLLRKSKLKIIAANVVKSITMLAKLLALSITTIALKAVILVPYIETVTPKAIATPKRANTPFNPLDFLGSHRSMSRITKANAVIINSGIIATKSFIE
jgi:hypothetical protein